jgi:uncharacterized protein (TIGR02145 family)
MKNLIPILLAVVVLSSGCDPDGYSCNSEGCYAENNAQYLTLEDCLSACDEQILGGCGSPVLHEGYNYSTVQIGDQCWFAENCRYLPEVSPSSEGSETDPYYYVNYYEGSTLAASQATANYETYGVLYNWPAVMTEGVCPSGWHVPSGNEFYELVEFLGGESVAGYAMKSTSGWNYNGSTFNGSNSSGFNGLPGGTLDYSYDMFCCIGKLAKYWTSTESASLSLSMDSYAIIWGDVYRHQGHACRCVRD